MSSFSDRNRFRDDRHRHQGTGVKIAVRGVDFWYGRKQALKGVDLDVHENEVTAFIGPSGCGKSTLLRSFNRTNEIIDGAKLSGEVQLNGRNIYDKDTDPTELRRRFGWVAQRPNPFPKSIYENIAYGVRIQGLAETQREMDETVEWALVHAGMWDEMKDRLREQGTALSGGQQQRLCIARAIATRPEVLLMDEPCSALDPHATAKVEELIEELKLRYTIVIVTHNLAQAARISQRTAFFYLGELIEAGDTVDIFTNPQSERLNDYVTGRYG